MTSENDRKILDEAEKECDREIGRIDTQFERSAKLLIALGVCLCFYYRNLGLIAALIVGILPLLVGIIVTFCMIGVAVRKYLRICKAIPGPDDDPDPDNKEKVPEITKDSSPESNVVPLFPPQKGKKAA